MSALADRPLLYSARPAIALAGNDQPALSAAAISLSVRDTTAGLVSLECTFGNWGARNGHVGYLYFDRATLDFGTESPSSWARGKPLAKCFGAASPHSKDVSRSSARQRSRCWAEDGLQDLRMTRRNAHFRAVERRGSHQSDRDGSQARQDGRHRVTHAPCRCAAQSERFGVPEISRAHRGRGCLAGRRQAPIQGQGAADRHPDDAHVWSDPA